MTFWSILRQRCWGLVLVVAGVCVITFIISHLIPGDPARLLAGDRASDAIVENIRQQLGLDQPLYVQFYRYVSDLFHGDLGTSIRTGRPVLEELRIFFPATLELAFCALLLALLIGIPLGILSAVWRNRWLDHLVRIMAITGISTPAFWLGLGVIVLFYGHLQILPGGGRLDDWLDPPTHVTGFYLLDALLEGNGEVFFNALQHLILPALTLAFVHLGIVARQIRSAMLEQLSEDYIRTARASGLPGWYIVLCYALPNALIPSITVLGLALGDLLYGAVLTETVFAWPGMSSEQQRRALAEELAVQVGIRPEYLDRLPHAFSGGQRQRIAIARALSSQPDVIVLDEPTSALDISVQAQILNLLVTLQVNRGLTYVLISHNVSVIRHMSDRVAVMYLGQIVELGDAQQVLTAPAHPYTRLLLDSLPAIDKPLEEEWALRKTDLPGNRTLPQGCFFYERCPLATHGCEVRQSLTIREDGREIRCWRAL